jgi:hypothetical protein
MNRLIALLSVVLMLAIFPGVSHAKAKGDASTPKDGTKKKENMLVGTVLKVDGNSIVVKTRGKNAGEVTVVTDSKTEFLFNGKSSTIEKIKPGQEAVVMLGTGSSAPAVKFSSKDDSKKKKKKKKDA